MDDDRQKSPEHTPAPASAGGTWAQLSLVQQIITGMGATISAVVVIAGAVIFLHDWWIKTFIKPLVIAVAGDEMKAEKEALTLDIKTKITKDLLEGENLRIRINQQASELLESSLKTKIGPMVEGTFILDHAKTEEKFDVYWKNGYSAWLWVYLEKLENEDCILIQPPTVIMPKLVMSPGLSKPINIAKMLKVQPGLQLASGQENEGETVERTKGIFDNVYQLTFRLGTKDNKAATGSRCGSDVNDKSGPVTVEYFMATAPPVSIPPIDEKDTQ